MFVVLLLVSMVFWLLAALLTLKCDSMFCARPTSYSSHMLFMAFVVWPVIAVLLLTTRHDVSLGDEERFDY